MRLFSLLSLASVTSLLFLGCGGDAVSGSNGGSGGETGTTSAGGGGASATGGSGGSGTTTTSSETTTSTPGEPINTPKEQWTWVPFDNAFCANGTPTGIGANITDKSSKVVIYLMGGGACWNDLTCYSLKTAVNIESGYGEAEFDKDKAGLDISVFDRNNPDNPLKDASFFFVPYCTGDVHAGNNPDAVYGGKPTKHVGFANMALYLSRIVATFPQSERVLLSGSSAGGFGAGLNWWQTQQAFGAARVDLLDDSGPALPAPYLSDQLQGQWRAAWNLNATLPDGCPECQTDLSNIFSFYAKNLPNNRAALLSYDHDNVISSYFQISQAKFNEGLGVLEGQFDAYANSRYYVVTGTDHVLLGNPSAINQNGVNLLSWIGQMEADDAAWANVKP
ncbi:MAG: pectin acetylesterase-family hydrolase [Polyangiaceae bacterium]